MLKISIVIALSLLSVTAVRADEHDATAVATTATTKAPATESSATDKVVHLKDGSVVIDGVLYKRADDIWFRQLEEQRLMRQEMAHQTEQQAKDAQHLRYRVRKGIIHNLIFDPPQKVSTPSTVDTAPPPAP